jgi:hypothetical protein
VLTQTQTKDYYVREILLDPNTESEFSALNTIFALFYGGPNVALSFCDVYVSNLRV